MTKKNIIEATVLFVKQELSDAEGGHDWWHIYRVWNTTKKIAKEENTNLLVCELAALLHDIADSKFYDGDDSIGAKKSKMFLKTLNLDEETINHVVAIIENVSFKGGKVTRTFSSLELNVVQDADRLDAIGAVGIARTFNYGGFKNRAIYDPAIPPDLNMTKEQYKKSTAPTINHFHEKLLLLKDLMNTPSGKKIAEHRHQFMKQYLDQFYAEFEGDL